jgi:hypothetical protein
VTAAGYLHPAYAESFAEFGTPLPLPASEGWLIRRAIPGTASFDAMGCYPLFCCGHWKHLPQDLDALEGSLVSVVLVTDPFGEYTSELLERAFGSVKPFKDHYVIETGRPPAAFVSASHRANAMRALRKVEVELCPDPLQFIDDWERLFRVLAERHSISGYRRFSRSAFEKQLAVPGMVMFRAVAEGRTVGLDLWYLQGDCAQGHLAAFDATGYALRASYATKWRMIEHFGDKVRWINLGAGIAADSTDGLSQFKRGWSTGTKRAWLCGRILQPAQYAELARSHGEPGRSFFPAYRSAE